jgi:hypothetical protein
MLGLQPSALVTLAVSVPAAPMDAPSSKIVHDHDFGSHKGTSAELYYGIQENSKKESFWSSLISRRSKGRGSTQQLWIMKYGWNKRGGNQAGYNVCQCAELESTINVVKWVFCTFSRYFERSLGYTRFALLC